MYIVQFVCSVVALYHVLGRLLVTHLQIGQTKKSLMHEAQLTLFQTKRLSVGSMRQIRLTNLNLLQNLHGEIFCPYVKFPIMWIPY